MPQKCPVFHRWPSSRFELQPYNKADLPADFSTAIPQIPLPSSPFIQRDGQDGITIDAPNYIMPIGSNLLGTYS